MKRVIFSSSSGHWRIGGRKIRKPYKVSVYVDGLWIDFKFYRNQEELRDMIYNVIVKEMRLNLKYAMLGESAQ